MPLPPLPTKLVFTMDPPKDAYFDSGRNLPCLGKEEVTFEMPKLLPCNLQNLSVLSFWARMPLPPLPTKLVFTIDPSRDAYFDSEMNLAWLGKEEVTFRYRKY